MHILILTHARAHMHTYTHTHTHTHTHTCKNKQTHANTCKHMQTHANTRRTTDTYHAHMHTSVCACENAESNHISEQICVWMLGVLILHSHGMIHCMVATKLIYPFISHHGKTHMPQTAKLNGRSRHLATSRLHCSNFCTHMHVRT